MSDSAFLGAASANAVAVANDDVTIISGGVAWGGWEEVSISRGIETIPSSFNCRGTERYPGATGDSTVDIIPGSPCVIKIGADTVITGYVDIADRRVTPDTHEVEVAGRSKLCDLVDCSGFLKKWQFTNLTLLNIATQICAQFGITASAPDGDSAALPTVSVIITETGYEMLEEMARYVGKLLYDDTAGNLVIAGLGTNTHSSGVVEGVNVQEMRGTINASERMTEIAAVYTDTAILTDGAGSTTISIVQNAQATDTNWPARADGQPRYRPLLIISEQGSGQNNVVPRRIQWEMARRIGRSQQVEVTVDTWRDSAGTLWAPNYLIPVSLPSMKMTATTWLITNVTYIKDDRGTYARLLLMPPQAMAPMPQAPFLYSAALAAASGDTTGAQPSPTTGN